MVPLFNRLPRGFVLLLGVALAGLALQALFGGAVETPSSSAFFRAQITRAEQPGTYWLLVLTYAAGAALFLAVAWRRYRDPDDEAYEPAPPPPPRPGWARALAWLGLLLGAALLGAAVWSHFALDAIISLPFVFLFGGGGLFIGLSAVGYLVTGRVQ